jgi:hypothetical protein
MDENIKKAIEAVAPLATDVYKDGVKPSLESMGIILSFIPRTIRVSLQSWEKWIVNGEESMRLFAESVKDKLKNIPEDKICEPEPYVAIPAIQQLSYCQDSIELRELYANLLVSSMNTDTKWQVHPSYVTIIKQLCPDEAKILKSLLENPDEVYPVVDIYKNIKEGVTMLLTNYTDSFFKYIENKKSICRYIDNFCRLGLLEIRDDVVITNNEIYESMKSNPVLDYILSSMNSNQTEINFSKKVLLVSNLGKEFIRTSCR